MGDISSLPADIIHNILVRLPLNLLVKLKYVCKRWNRLLSDPYYGPRGDRKILLPFAPINSVDVLEEKMVTLDNFANLDGKVVTFVGSCNGIVLLVINQDEHTRMVLYNPLTGEKKLVPDELHSQCRKSSKHVYGFGYGSTPDDLKIVRFRFCECSSYGINDDPYTCDVFSPKTNSWTMLNKFVQNAIRLNEVGTFANGSLHWLAVSMNYQECKIVALDINNMILSDIRLLPFRRLFYHMSLYRLGTLHGSLCILAEEMPSHFESLYKVWVMTAGEGGENKSWLEASSFKFNLPYSRFSSRYSTVIILDDGMVAISIDDDDKKLVIFDTMKHSHKVIKISKRPSWFQWSHGIEYVESLVSPSSLFHNTA